MAGMHLSDLDTLPYKHFIGCSTNDILRESVLPSNEISTSAYGKLLFITG